MSGHRARPAYDRWRDAAGRHVPNGCRVEQVEVDRDRGALRWRLHHQGEVTGRGRGSRLQVRFDGEDKPVSIRPHLVRVLRIDAGQSVGQLEQLRTPLPAHTPPEQALSAGSCDG